jgi:hypothetical protein
MKIDEAFRRLAEAETSQAVTGPGSENYRRVLRELRGDPDETVETQRQRIACLEAMISIQADTIDIYRRAVENATAFLKARR